MSYKSTVQSQSQQSQKMRTRFRGRNLFRGVPRGRRPVRRRQQLEPQRSQSENPEPSPSRHQRSSGFMIPERQFIEPLHREIASEEVEISFVEPDVRENIRGMEPIDEYGWRLRIQKRIGKLEEDVKAINKNLNEKFDYILQALSQIEKKLP